MKKDKKKVILGMSAGVDSTVAAFLLQKQGFEVVGVFMHFWKEESLDKTAENKCCSLESYQELKKICQQLKIKLVTVNVAREFRKEIVGYFLKEYENGRTPNPCVVCNREIKFKFLLQKMLEIKADYLATGHYALIKNKNGLYKLFEAKDKEKDQTYFLYNLNQKQLAKILFPVGGYKKSEIRQLAKKFNLSVHSKKESQDICFVAKDVNSFLQKYLKLKKGKIVNQEGKVVGEHLGLPLYTFGQRKGINIGGDGPYYVSGKDFQKNILQVTNCKDDRALLSHGVELEKANWISGLAPKIPMKVRLRTRYRNPLVSAIIESHNVKRKTLNVSFDRPQKNIAPGQSVVFYGKGGEVFGGGVIK